MSTVEIAERMVYKIKTTIVKCSFLNIKLLSLRKLRLATTTFGTMMSARYITLHNTYYIASASTDKQRLELFKKFRFTSTKHIFTINNHCENIMVSV